MRKFVAACCCVIVGLEVLIAVPLVVCVVMFAYMEAAGTTVTVQAQPVDFPGTGYHNPAIVPAPSYSSPYPTSPSPAAMAILPAPVAPTTCPLPPLPAEITAIAEVRQHNGSPLDGTIVAPSSPALPPAIDPFVAAVEQVAVNEAACLMPPPEASAQPPATVLKPEPEAEPAAGPKPAALLEALYASSEHLYLKANDLEADGNYSRADEVRSLARRIRDEIDILRRESPTTPPVPSTVTAASFNPQSPDRAPIAPTTTPAIPLGEAALESVIPPVPPVESPSEEAKVPTIPAP